MFNYRLTEKGRMVIGYLLGYLPYVIASLWSESAWCVLYTVISFALSTTMLLDRLASPTNKVLSFYQEIGYNMFFLVRIVLKAMKLVWNTLIEEKSNV